MTRIANGVYTVPPNGADGRRWKVPLEAASLITTPAQTFYDYWARGRHNGDAEATQEGITNLAHRVTQDEIAAIADRHLRVGPTIRDFIRTGAL